MTRAGALGGALFVCALGAFARSPSASAQTLSLQDSVIKIYSKADAQDQTFVGTGFLFQQGGKAYVLTSEHVVLHSNQATKHAIWNAKLGYVQARYVISDWGFGLALMAVSALPAATAAELAPLESLHVPPGGAASGDAIVGYGYPANSQQLIVSRTGKVSNPAQNLPILAEVPTLVEVAGGHAEFGMSGGPATYSDGDFAGVLSHQRLVGNTPGVWGPGDDPLGNHALLIPGDVALGWVKRYFADPTHFVVKLAQEENFQLQVGYKQIQTTDLYLDWIDNYVPGKSAVEMELYRANDSNTLYDNAAGDMAAIEKKLRAGTTALPNKIFGVRFAGFRVRRAPADPEFFNPKIIGYDSTEEFLRLFVRPDLEPLAASEMNYWDDEDNKVLALGKELRDDYDRLPRQFLGGELEGTLAVIGDNLSQTDQDDLESAELWQMYRPSDFDVLLSHPRFSAEWARLKAAGADAKLMDVLNRIKTEMRYLAY